MAQVEVLEPLAAEKDRRRDRPKPRSRDRDRCELLARLLLGGFDYFSIYLICSFERTREMKGLTDGRVVMADE